ncbi:hypothetical protein TrRE_jg9167 [Triparma retinervis]|uniref:Uncharacterized protein n=1 Tax=Triparma retinervis TaxID=2557542 RepID=A0A9W7CFD6_9STRA|nr:hypothetical protein TrRE_jg9167 [Triparma retinervis]
MPGSGKSTFARQLNASFPGVIVTVCQDVLKSRGKCEKVTRTTLQENPTGRVVVVDRTNISREQRTHWYRIAEECGSRVDVIYFKRTPEECISRADLRLREGGEGHPTITKLGGGKRVVNMMKNKITLPTEIESKAVRNIFVSENDEDTKGVLKFYLDVGGGVGEGGGEVIDLTEHGEDGGEGGDVKRQRRFS